MYYAEIDTTRQHQPVACEHRHRTPREADACGRERVGRVRAMGYTASHAVVAIADTIGPEEIWSDGERIHPDGVRVHRLASVEVE